MKQIARLIFYVVAGGLALVGLHALLFPSMACAQTGSWQDVPPARYQRIVSATVHYADPETIRTACVGYPRPTGCSVGSTIYLPLDHSPTGQRLTRFEIIDVAAEYRGGTIRGAYRGHEGAHVAGWPADHPR